MLHMKFIADDPVTVTKIVGRLAKFNRLLVSLLIIQEDISIQLNCIMKLNYFISVIFKCPQQ